MDWFSAQTAFAASLARALATLSSFGQDAQICLGHDGVLVSACDVAGAAGASLFIDRALFTEFRALETAEPFSVELAAFVRVLKIFGGWREASNSGTAANNSLDVDISYSGDMRQRGTLSEESSTSLLYTPGQPLELRCSIDLMLSQAAITVIECSGRTPPTLDRSLFLVHAIMPGRVLRWVLRECESARASELELVHEPTTDRLEFRTHGSLLQAQFVLGDSPRGSLDSLEIKAEGSWKYDFGLISRAKLAASRATKAALRIDANGVLSLQTMHDVGVEQVYCDMVFLPLELEL